MELVEFLFPLKGGPVKDLCIASLYYQKHYKQQPEMTVRSIRNVLKLAAIPRAAHLNISDALSKGAPYIHVSNKKGNCFFWAITKSGEDYVRKLLNLPINDAEIQQDVSTLDATISSIKDVETQDYIKEAIRCISVGSLRAAIVFVWSGAVDKIKKSIMTYAIKDINNAAQKYDPKARLIKKVDHLAYFKESILLLIAQDLGLFDKNEKGILEDALNLRNKCGHPGKYKVGPKKVSSFIEDVTGILFN